MRAKVLPYWVRKLPTLLIAIMAIKIMGYFCIVEERAINQIFKVVTRLGMTVTIAGVFFALKQIGCRPIFAVRNGWSIVLYLGYLLLGIASFGWSTDVKYSMLQWSMTFESLVFVYFYAQVLAQIRHYFPSLPIVLDRIFTWAIFPIMIVFLLGALLFPDLFYRAMRGGAELRLGGYYMNPNELGMLASIGASMSFLLVQKSTKKWPYMLTMIAALLVLMLTSSRSSAIGFVLIIGVLILQSNNKRLKLIMGGLMLLGVPALLQLVVFKSAGGMDEVMSMTGRLPFWKALLNEGIIKEPFLGYGFMRINYTDYFESINTYAGKMTHNTFMQVLMNLGFVGLYIVFWQLFLTIRGYVTASKTDANRNFFMALFIPIFINSLTEFGIFGETNYGILFYQILLFTFAFYPRISYTKSEGYAVRLFAKRWQPLS